MPMDVCADVVGLCQGFPGSQDLCRATFLQPGGAASASTAGSHLPSGSPRSWLSSWCFGEGSSLQRVPGHTGQRAAAWPACLALVPARLFPADSRRNSRKGIGLSMWELASEPARCPVPQTPRRNPAVAPRCFCRVCSAATKQQEGSHPPGRHPGTTAPGSSPSPPMICE